MAYYRALDCIIELIHMLFTNCTPLYCQSNRCEENQLFYYLSMKNKIDSRAHMSFYSVQINIDAIYFQSLPIYFPLNFF